MQAIRRELLAFLEELRGRPDIEVLKGQVGAADAAPSELARLASDAPELAAFYEHINGVDIAMI